MRRKLRAGVYVSTLAVFTALCGVAGASRDGWYEDLNEAVRVARREGKPILADFSTSWCHNCRDLEKKTFNHPAVVQRLDRFVKVYVDGDQHPDMVQQYGVQGYPTLVALSPSGKEIDRSIGYVDSGTLASTLDGVVQEMGPGKRSEPSAQKSDKAAQDLGPVDGGPSLESAAAGEQLASTRGKSQRGGSLYEMAQGQQTPASQARKGQTPSERALERAKAVVGPKAELKMVAQQLPRPLLDVGATREGESGLPAPSVKPVASKSTGQESSASAKGKSSADPLATVRKLEAGGKPAKAATKATAGKSGDSGASQEQESGATTSSEPKTTLDVRSRAKDSSAEQSEEIGDLPQPKGRDSKSASAQDIARWIKDADSKMQSGRKNEARAMYAKVVEFDPENVHGHSDVAFIKMVSLSVDRNDDFLRKQAYEKIKEFPSRFPNSAHQDYYTLIRAMLAQDLGETDEACALLQDYPKRFPDSPYVEMAYQTWNSLQASSDKPQGKKSASKSSSKSKSSKSTRKSAQD